MDPSSPAFQRMVTLQSELFKVLANRTRLSLINLLKEGERVPLITLRETLGISKANLSQHLAILRNAGVVEIIPTGRTSIAKLRTTKLVDACSMVRELLKEKLANDMVPFLDEMTGEKE